MKSISIFKVTIPLLIIILIGCATQPELSTDIEEWRDCRNIAWDNCFGIDEEFVDIFNMLCSNYDVLNSSQCKVLNGVHSNCWLAQSDLCDSQFDMDIIEAQDGEISNEI